MNKCKILSFNRIMKLYSDVYMSKIVKKRIMRINIQLDISHFAHFKHNWKIYGCCAYILIIIKKFMRISKNLFNDKSFEMHFLREQF